MASGAVGVRVARRESASQATVAATSAACAVAELEGGGGDGGGVECFVEGGGDGGAGGDVGGCGGGGDVGDGGCGGVLGCVGGEDDVDPVVACLPGLVGEAWGGCVAVDAVAVLAVAERVEGAVAVGAGEVVEVERVVAVGGVVGGEVGGAGADGDRVGEVDLLPAARALAGEGRTREQRSLRAPEAAQMRTRIPRTLEETDTGHVPSDARRELDSRFDRRRVARRGDGGLGCAIPDRARAGDVDRCPRERGLEVSAVVHGARLEPCLAVPVGDPRVAPARCSDRWMPRLPAVCRHLDARDVTAARVGRGSGNRHRSAVGHGRSSRRRVDRRERRGSISRRDGRNQLRLERRRLHVHVGEEVHGRLLHPAVRRTRRIRREDVVHVIEPPGPLHRAGPEHECAARSAVQVQRVRCGAGGVDAPVVLDVLVDGQRRRGEPHQPGGPEAVVPVLVPLVPERARRKRCGLARSKLRDAGIPPEAKCAERRRDLDRILAVGVDREQRSCERVLRPSSVCGRAEARVAPRSGPFRAGIDLRVRGRLLVRDEGGVRGCAAGDARLPAGLPEHLVTAEERKVDAGVPGRFHVGTLPARPVLVVSDREECLVLEKLCPSGGSVDPGEVADVVAVALEPADHRVLAAEEERGVVVAPRRERPVVAHLVGAARRSADVEAVAPVSVVRLPRRVRGLEEEVGVAVVVSDDEVNVALPARVGSNELADIDAGHRRGRDVERRRLRPVAAIDQTRRCLRNTCRLLLGQRRAGSDRRNLPRSEPAVVPEAIDVDAIGGCVRLHLEVDRLAVVDAEGGCVPLDAVVPGPCDVPLAPRAAGERVLAGDDICDWRLAGIKRARACVTRPDCEHEAAAQPAARIVKDTRRNAGTGRPVTAWSTSLVNCKPNHPLALDHARVVRSRQRAMWLVTPNPGLPRPRARPDLLSNSTEPDASEAPVEWLARLPESARRLRRTSRHRRLRQRGKRRTRCP